MSAESISGVSDNLKADLAARYEDFKQLQTALQGGNIAQAQSAFAAFQQVIGKVTTSAGPHSLFASGSQPSKDLQALGNALKSGDLASSQQAFAALKTDIQNAGQLGGGVTDNFSLLHPNRSTLATNMQSFSNHGNQSKGQSAGAVLNLQA